MAQHALRIMAALGLVLSIGVSQVRAAVLAARRAGLRVEADLRNEKITYKVREHSVAKIPVLLVVGKKEAAHGTVSIRRLGSQAQTVVPLEKALAMLSDEAVPPDLKRMKLAA